MSLGCIYTADGVGVSLFKFAGLAPKNTSKVFDLDTNSQLTAGYWQNGCCPVRLSGWLVGKSCLSRVSLSVRAIAAEGRQARVCTAAVRKHGRRGATAPSV